MSQSSDSGSKNQQIKAKMKIIDGCDGADGAKTDSYSLQELAATLRQGFAKMSQDFSETIAVIQTYSVRI